jgi:endogenous inhibitor of DNA gyrase (YacG/DUF329 family)
MSQKIARPCPTCRTSLRRGLLWLRGRDYLECPECQGTGIFVMYEQRVMPKTRILVPGQKKGA